MELVRFVGGSLRRVGGFDHSFPATKLGFSPLSTRNELLASVGDALRLWEVGENYKTTLVQTFTPPKVHYVAV